MATAQHRVCRFREVGLEVDAKGARHVTLPVGGGRIRPATSVQEDRLIEEGDRVRSRDERA
jgi:hypothetical protein